MKVKVIYFKGCPNAAKVEKNLKEIGVEFTMINQDDLPTHDALRRYSSPTILLGDEIVFGARTDSGGGGCSLGVPSVEDIRRLLG